MSTNNVPTEAGSEDLVLTLQDEDTQVPDISEGAVFMEPSELNAIVEKAREHFIDTINPIVLEETTINFNDILEQQASAAGLGGVGQSNGHSFVRVGRVQEFIDPVDYSFPTIIGEEIFQSDVLVAQQGQNNDTENQGQIGENRTDETGHENNRHIVDSINPSIPSVIPGDMDDVRNNGIVPEEPVIPDVPEEPVIPDVPEEPVIPVVPEEPVIPVVPEEPEGTKGNNGWGNGDQSAPGNSSDNNNAENNTSGKEDPTSKNNHGQRYNYKLDNSSIANDGGNDPAGDADSVNTTIGDVKNEKHNDKIRGNDDLDSNGNIVSGVIHDDVKNQSNPGNDKDVGKSPWDGHTGDSSNTTPSYKDNRNMLGDDSESNQPPGIKIKDILYDDSLFDSPGNGKFKDESQIIDLQHDDLKNILSATKANIPFD